jgi:autotransporter-associated beta strand protein
MMKKYIISSVVLCFFLCAPNFASAQQNVFSRSEVSTGNFGDGQLPWYYQTDNNSQGDPDSGSSTRHFVKIGHNNNTTMTTNGRFYLVNTLDFEAGASSARTINNSGGGLSASGGIYNASSATHTFNTPIGIDGSNVQIHANSSGGLVFTQTIFLNANIAEFGNIGTGNISVSGTINGTGGINKVGSNTLTLSGSNDHTGSTTISGGTLVLQSNISSSTVTVENGGTLVIDGDITLSELTVNAGGTVNIPATSNLTVSGNLNVSGTLNMTSTSTQYPSLIVNGSTTGNMTYHRYVNSNTNGNDLVSSPVSSQSWASFLGINGTDLLDDGNVGPTAYAFGPFNKTIGDFENYTDATSATLTSGTGYRAATNTGTTLAFTGTFSAGTETAAISNSGPSFTEWNLIGNPYPAYLNVQDFLNNTANTTLLDETSVGIYGYDGDASNGWTIYNLSNTTASTVITPGQGFFVAAEANGNIEFTSAMRRTGTADDFISGRNAELVYLMLQLSTDTSNYKTDFYFNANASLGLDPGYDTGVWSGTTPSFGIYSNLVEDNAGSELAIQSLNPSDLSEMTIPLGVNANQGEQLRFSIMDSTLPESVSVYLIDVVANTTTLLNNSDYVLTPSTALNGTGRFFLRTSEDALSTLPNRFDTLSVYALTNSKEVVVSGLLKSDTMFHLYDIQGRFVLSTLLDATRSQNRIDVSSLNGGVYVVTIQNNEQQKSQKLIIK